MPTKLITMIKYMVQIIDIFAFFVAVIKWCNTFVPLVKIGLKAPEQFSHGEITLSIPPIARRVIA